MVIHRYIYIYANNIHYKENTSGVKKNLVSDNFCISFVSWGYSRTYFVSIPKTIVADCCDNEYLKGGSKMVEKVVKAGYEEIYDTAVAKLENLEEEIRREVEEKFAGHKEALTNIIAQCVEEVEVAEDEPVEEEQAVEETEYAGE